MLIVSIALEAAVAILAVLAARRGKPYVYGLAFTFGAYVLYDLARLLQWNVQAGILSMVVSAGDHQCPDRGMGAVPEITGELVAAIRLPRPLNVLAGRDVLSRGEFLYHAPAVDTVLLR